jgi:type IV secretion system protein TrbJ
MKITKKKWISASIAGLMGIGLAVEPTPIYALFGFGDIVFDPSAYATLGKIWSQEGTNYEKLVDTYNESVKIYETGVAAYNLAEAMSHRVQNKNTWKLAAFAVENEIARNHYNESVNFTDVANGDVRNAGTAWNQSTYAAPDVAYLGSVKPNQSRRMSEYATLQMLDQTSERCSAILANYKQTQDQNQTPDDQFSSDVLDQSDAKNAEVAVLNVLSGGALHLKTQQRANGNLEACLAEQNTLQAKLQRDRLAEEQEWYSDQAQERATAPALLDPDATASVIGNYLEP